MVFKFLHNNFNVLDLEKSLKFYEDALGLKEVRRKVAGDGSFILVYLGDGQTPHQLELTWLRDRKEPYNLGENEFHLAFGCEWGHSLMQRAVFYAGQRYVHGWSC